MSIIEKWYDAFCQLIDTFRAKQLSSKEYNVRIKTYSYIVSNYGGGRAVLQSGSCFLPLLRMPFLIGRNNKVAPGRHQW